VGPESVHWGRLMEEERGGLGTIGEARVVVKTFIPKLRVYTSISWENRYHEKGGGNAHHESEKPKALRRRRRARAATTTRLSRTFR